MCFSESGYQTFLSVHVESDLYQIYSFIWRKSDWQSAHNEWADIIRIAAVVRPIAKSREQFLAECKTGSFDGVVVIYRTFESLEQTGRFDEELLSALPSSVKFVCHKGITCISYVSPRHQGLSNLFYQSIHSLILGKALATTKLTSKPAHVEAFESPTFVRLSMTVQPIPPSS